MRSLIGKPVCKNGKFVFKNMNEKLVCVKKILMNEKLVWAKTLLMNEACVCKALLRNETLLCVKQF